MPKEMSRMLDELGYDWLPIRDPAMRQPVKVAWQYGQYRMQFKARDRPSIRIDVHIRIDDGTTAVYFHESGEKGLTSTSDRYYRKLRARLVLEFGTEHVSGRYSLLDP